MKRLDRFQCADYFSINGAAQATVPSLPPCWTLAEIRLGLFFGVWSDTGMRMTAQHIVSVVETNPSDFEDWLGLHGLLSDSFAYMNGRIDPPSSLLRLTPDGLEQKSRTEDLYLIRDYGAPVACALGTIAGECYYLGKLAVAASQRGQGLAREIIEAAAQTARKRGLRRLELQTRVELRENHRTFRRLGFTLVGASAHTGYDHATSLTFRRRV